MDCNPAPSAITLPTDALSRLANAWIAFAEAAAKARWHTIDAVLAERKRAARDHCDLAAMSERELKDIGIDRASIAAVAAHDWTRDGSPY